MLDLDRINGIRLSATPWFQKLVARGILMPNYHTPPRVKIIFEGEDQLPDEPVIYAMNHTDRYNYWPLQYKAWRSLGRFTAAWVKGKYYENPLMGKFMEKINSIPTVSRGYLIARDFKSTLQRRPSNEEYAATRGWVDAQAAQLDGTRLEAPTTDIPAEILTRGRDILGRVFNPQAETYAQSINALFGKMMRRFVALNQEARDIGLDTIIFPEGTRSLRLAKGRIGLSQIVLAHRRTVVPVGCSGCSDLYPGSSPWAKGGTVTYRFGAPITYEDMAPYHTGQDFEPFTPEAEANYRDKFQALVDEVMLRINELLDERYQFGEDAAGEGTVGSKRFM